MTTHSNPTMLPPKTAQTPWLADFWQTLVQIRQQQGWKGLLQLALLTVFESHDAIIMRRPLSEPIPDLKPRVEMVIQQATLADLPLLKTIVPPLRLRRFAAKMAAGEMCVIGIYEGKVIAMGWVGLGGGPSVRETTLQLTVQDAYVWGGYMAPEYRSQGGSSAILSRLMQLSKEVGCEYIYLVTEKTNAPVIKQGHKLGFHNAAYLRSVRLFKWWWWRKTAVNE